MQFICFDAFVNALSTKARERARIFSPRNSLAESFRLAYSVY